MFYAERPLICLSPEQRFPSHPPNLPRTLRQLVNFSKIFTLFFPPNMFPTSSQHVEREKHPQNLRIVEQFKNNSNLSASEARLRLCRSSLFLRHLLALSQEPPQLSAPAQSLAPAQLLSAPPVRLSAPEQEPSAQA